MKFSIAQYAESPLSNSNFINDKLLMISVIPGVNYFTNYFFTLFNFDKINI